ncbi:MAG: hypothetical protein KKB59_19145 [Spirochaetes bacterium]|nr:hypothetical protein [Spirochaetota bacterium]
MAAPKVISAEAISSTEVKVTFDQPMLKDAELTKTTNYIFTQKFGDVTITASSVVPEDIPEPAYATVITDTQRAIEQYEVEISNVKNAGSEDINTDYDTASFLGYGIAADIRGYYLLQDSEVYFGESLSPDVLWVDENRLRAEVPEGSGTVDIKVVGPPPYSKEGVYKDGWIYL